MSEVQVDERTALDAANELEREIQFKGREDPEKFKMPDGSTLAETRQKLDSLHEKEGKADLLINRKQSRKLARESHDIAEKDARIIINEDNGQVSIAKNPNVSDGQKMKRNPPPVEKKSTPEEKLKEEQV